MIKLIIIINPAWVSVARGFRKRHNTAKSD
jgi:hypothetical protein